MYVKKMRSIRKCLKTSTIIAIILVLYIFSILGFIVRKIETFENVYKDLRACFSVINEVVAGRQSFDKLLPMMERFGYDTTRYHGLLKALEESSIPREEVTVEVRNFANFLRKYELEKLRLHNVAVRTAYVSLIIVSTLILLLLAITTNRVKRYIVKILDKVKEISDNIYISPIPVGKPEFLEDFSLNRSIESINLVQSIYNAFKHAPINTSIEDFIFTVGPYLCSLFNSQRFSVALIDWENEEVIAEVAYISKPGVEPRLKAGFVQKLYETSLGDMIKNNQTTRIINNLSERYEKTKSPSTKLILDEGFRSSLTVVATINSRPFGFFFLSSERENNYTEQDAKLFASILNILSYRLFYSLTIQRLLSHFGNSLVNLVEFKDNETGNHIRRVSLYAKIIAEELALSPKLIREIYEFSPLHDIGKVGIPDSILLKPGKLDPEEWEIMKTHVEKGVKIIEEFQQNARNIMEPKSLETMKNIIADHHERWDGRGYPVGKKGEEISIEGRIVALADVFDALTTKRPYKEAIPFDEAVKIIQQESGSHFDPKVVEAFVKRIKDIRNVYEALKD
ncbi:HD-GYP domain-containing protein [Fervidobacterium thailandense]|uniref:HD-GYP domain-containing protein n=1 Tax=Fervidobacterium thailandense TaxID=1008305 RepID=A0A1E3G1C9_9BACT|nr:HD domain-containing phosphohydrolase [Fervidobacterium thailandense]ODN30054.1 hypothetical protein A4H02_07700 [Fervidobacterium thailandense]